MPPKRKINKRKVVAHVDYVDQTEDPLPQAETYDDSKTVDKYSFPSNCILLNKTKICCTTSVPLSCDRQSMLCENRTKGRQSCDCFTSVLQRSWDCWTTVVQQPYDCFVKMVYVSTHDNVFIARQSHDWCKTLSRQPQDNDTTKNCRAKMVHVQFSSHDTRQRHYAQNIVRLLCDCFTTIINYPRFDQISCRSTA